MTIAAPLRTRSAGGSAIVALAAVVVDAVLGIALALLAVAALGTGPASIGAVALSAAAPALARTDLRRHRLPNRMTLPAASAGLAGCAVAAATGRPWLLPLAAGLVPAAALLVLALVGGMGMGDVKLVLAIGLGSPDLLVAVAAPLLGILAGGVAGAIGLATRGARHRIPYGPFLLAGWVIALAARLLLDVSTAGATPMAE